MTDQRHPRETVEADIPFDQVLDLVRRTSRQDAAGLLHSALQVAFNNGEVAGGKQMAKIADDALRDPPAPINIHHCENSND